MEETIKEIFKVAAIVIEIFGGVVIVIATIRAIYRYFSQVLFSSGLARQMDKIRIRMGKSLSLGLEFLVAADILETVVYPILKEIAVLASLVGIRTILNFFLKREIEILTKETGQAYQD